MRPPFVVVDLTDRFSVYHANSLATPRPPDQRYTARHVTTGVNVV